MVAGLTIMPHDVLSTMPDFEIGDDVVLEYCFFEPGRSMGVCLDSAFGLLYMGFDVRESMALGVGLRSAYD